MRYVSHEIRTPLGVIVGGLDLLLLDLRERASVEVGAIDDAINDLRYSCDIATGILDELLLLEQLEGGIMKLKLEKLEVRKVIEDAIRPLPFQARLSGINFVSPTASDVEDQCAEYVIHGDYHNLTRAVRDL
eukprot:gene864-963_t